MTGGIVVVYLLIDVIIYVESAVLQRDQNPDEMRIISRVLTGKGEEIGACVLHELVS